GTPTLINTSPIPPTSGTAASPYPFSVSASGTGTLTFYVTAVDSGGNESAPSTTASFPYNLTPMTCTVATNPAALQITVDGTALQAPQVFTTPIWMVGQKHTLAVISPQTPSQGVQYIFAKWDDNASTSKTRTITVSSGNTTYQADFTAQYSLTTSVSPSNGGTVTPAGTTWYNIGKSVSVTAKPKFGYTFAGWSGGASGTSPSVSLPITSPMTVVANFAAIPEEVTIPTTPKSVTNGFTGTSYTFSTKSTSNLGNPVQYQYNWGDGTTSNWGPATQSHFWITAGGYNVTVTAKSSTGVTSSPSAVSVNVQEKPFIHVTSPNGGETWVVGATHQITWISNYLDPTGTIYLYYSFAGAWYPITITNLQADSTNTSFSGNWTIPPMPPTGTPAPGSPVPKSHMSVTSIYIGNWLPGTGTWQCWDTNDKGFKILDNGWGFMISGLDKGGADLWFNTDESSFDGYGMSFKLGMFKIQGSYTVGANGQITGTYTLLDFESGTPLTNGSGNITTGTLNANATTMTMTWKDGNNAPVFTMSGAWLSSLTMPEDWSVQIAGSAKGTISPLTIESYQDSNNVVYANIFDLKGSGAVSDNSMTISIDGYFFFTPSKNVYGFYQFTIDRSIENGTLSGTLNPTTGKFTFSLVSSNGDRYTWSGVKIASPPPE
ncbi:MAG TPA: PKD domain-containing protein, partial [Thermodesulfobacteriota bacterium]|nr:PKD domain-containing protein [Thermodesulfobacteriota bacterium]